MKIAIISRHSVANYGSLWQAYALQTAIENLGHAAININYTPHGEIGGKLAFTLVNNSRWSKSLITKLLFISYQYPSFSYTFNTFKRFRNKYLKETKEYTKYEQLLNNPPNANVYCTGSDQVWNNLYDGKRDDVYFLNFLNESNTKISYAASFGGSKFESNNRDKYIKYFKEYKSITVREDSGVDILNNMGIDSEHVLDPTLLLSNSDWEKLLPNKECKEDYILIYQLRPNKEFDSYAMELAKRKKLKIIRMSTMLFQFTKCGEFKYLPEAKEFLWLIKNSKYFLTDSFHGTCFAINYKVNFIEILPGRYNARNLSLLKKFKLENRILNNKNNFDIVDEEIDWKYVYEKKEYERLKSIEKLKNMIEGV